MRREITSSLALAVSLAACGPTPGTTAGETESTTGTPPATASTDTTDAPTGTGEPPTDPPPFCAPGPCVTKVDYPCESELGGPCNDPCDDLEPTDCGGPDLCPPIEIKTQGDSDDYDVVVPEADALCVLQALRDRTPGRLRITWGDPQGFFGDAGVAIDATVSVVGGDVVRMDWEWIYNTCCVASYARIRRAVLQPPAFFDDCLSEPTPEKLIACFTAGSSAFEPAPEGWLPPWLVGGCDPGLPDGCGE